VTRRQLSGAQKRKAAKLKALAAGVLMPRIPTLKALASLTGVVHEKGRNYRDWKAGLISPEQYLISIRGTTALAGALAALEQERQREEIERLRAAVEQVQSAGSIGYMPPPAVASLEGPSAAPTGELLSTDADDDGCRQ
jgi:hypothetical protein